jgi:lipopolysaccharide transport system ATP-binding protein
VSPQIKVENISKAYRIGLKEQRHDTLGATIAEWVKSPFKNFKRLRSLSNFNNHDDADIFWALKDINFEVKKGEVLGIIGKNGAGKSTLLKILSRITEPTDGRIEIYGRVASLLEVGTGFNPELTGRENVYLNGTILGMTKKEIDNKFDEIVDFSGIEKFIDTPVKRYSSGMKVRLAFAVAAHLDPEILIIDEVLAVGDAEFQNKCLGKMQDLSGKMGRTVLFVSHNMAAVSSLCNKTIVIQNGLIIFDGLVEKGIELYLNTAKEDQNINDLNEFIEKQNDEYFRLKRFFISQNQSVSKNFYADKEIIICIDYKVIKDVLGLRIGFDLIDLISGGVIFRSFHDDAENQMHIIQKGDYGLRTTIPANLLKSGSFAIKLAIGIHKVRWVVFDNDLMLKFIVNNVEGLNGAFADSRPGFIMPKLAWENIKY